MRTRPLQPLLAAMILAAPLAAAPASAASQPQIGAAAVVDAPVGKPGGIMTPYVECSDYADEPSASATFTNLGTGQARSFSWTGIGPGHYFPRVPVGRYEIRTTADCDGVARTRVELVQVRQKTAARTVSPAEWRRIKKGMSWKKVTRIVGYPGSFNGRYHGVASRTYDMMRFWSFSVIEFKNGRVSKKYWNVDHD